MKKILLLFIIIVSFYTGSNAQVELIENIYPGTTSFIRDIFHTDSDVVYFNPVNRATNNRELWISDGTEEGTQVISSDLNIRSSISNQSYAYQNRVFFFWAENESGELGIYSHSRSDNQVRWIMEDSGSTTEPMYKSGAHVYLISNGGNGCEKIYQFEAGNAAPVSGCYNSIANLKIIEVFNDQDIREEVYFFEDDNRLMRFSNGVLIDVFEQANLVDQTGGSASLISVESDYFTIVGRKFIFHGTTNLDGPKYGVFSLDLDNYSLETLVNYPGSSSSSLSFDRTGIETELLHYLHEGDGVYFLTLDGSSSTSFSSNTIQNIVLYSSDGTSSGTQRIYEFKDVEPNPFSAISTVMHIQAKIGNTLVFKSLRSDEDIFNPEIYSLNLQTLEEKLIWDFTPSVGNTFDYFQGKFESGFAFYDYIEDERNARSFFIGNGTAGGTTYQIITTDEQLYEVKQGGLSVINDSVFVFVGKLDGSDNDAIFKYVYNCDVGDCDGSDDNGGGNNGGGNNGNEDPSQLTFYEEPFYLINGFEKSIPFLWEVTKSSFEFEDQNSSFWYLFDQFSSGINLFTNEEEFLEYFFENQLDPFALTGVTIETGDPEFMYDEEIVSPEIDISGKNNLNGSIVFIQNPLFMSNVKMDLKFDIRIDETWFNQYTFTGGTNADYELQTLDLKLNSLPEGDLLQFRISYKADSYGSTNFGAPVFAFDKLIIKEQKPDSDSVEVTYEKEMLFDEDFDVEIDNQGQLFNHEERGWDVIQSGLSTQLQYSSWKYSRLESNEDIDYQIYEGISNDGHLVLEPYEPFDFFTEQLVIYDEIIASPIISIEGKEDVYVKMNMIYQSLILDTDSVDFNILVRDTKVSEWMVLKEIKLLPDQLGGLEIPSPLKLDIGLNELFEGDSLQLGFRVAINNYQYSNLGQGYLIDSVQVYNRIPLSTTSIEESSELDGYALSQNYPNPFNPNSTVSYTIPSSGLVTLEVFNLLGQKVATLANEVQQAGQYSVNFDASALSSGIYIYRIQSGNFVQTKKMMLIK